MNRSRKKPPKDRKQLAIVKPSTEERGLRKAKESLGNAIAGYLAEIGRKGGLKGGKAFDDKSTKQRRSELAMNAAKRKVKKKPNA